MREPSTLTDSIARRVVALVMRFPALILVVTLVVAALAAMSARQLKVDSRLKVLLPQDSPSVVHLDRMTAEVGNHEDLYIVVRSPSRADNLAFAERLADAVAKDPEIRFVVFRRDTRFFDDNVLLYAPLADLLDIRRRVIERIQAEIRRELSPLGEYDKPVEDLDLSEDELRSRYDLPDRPSDYFETDEGRVVVIVARPTGSSTDFTSAAALLERIDGQVAGLNPTAQNPALTVEYAGGYSKNTRLTRRLQADVASGTAAALIILALTLVIYFRGIRAVPLILTPLVAAALVALAFAFYWVSYLNLVGAFMFAVLLGIGIDFGIHVLARYRDERGEGLDVREALEATLATAGVSTGAGAASTALAFALLGIAEFKGISQFGVIASVGIVLAFFCAVLVLPAMMVLFERVWPWRPPKRAAKHERRSLPRRFPWVSALACALVLAGAAASLARVGDVAFETDLRTFEVELETTDAERARALQYQEAVGEHESSTPAIAIADSPEETAFVFRHLRALVDLSEEQFEALVAGEPVPPKPRAAAKPEAKAADQKTAPAPAKDDGWGDDDDDDDAKAAEPVDATAEGAAKPEGSTPDEGAAAAKPASGGDDDEDEDDGWGDDDEDEEESEDPAFVELAKLAQARVGLDPQVEAALRSYGPERLRVMRGKLVDVVALDGFIPEQQAEKLTVIRDIRERIDAKRGSFKGEDAKKIDEWRRYLEVDAPIDVAHLPAWIRDPFGGAEHRGDFVYLRFAGRKSDYAHAKVLYDAFLNVRGPEGEVPVAATFFVTPEIFDALRRDGPIVMSLATGVLIVTALLMFRSLAGVLIVLSTVGVALAWLTGLMVALGWRWHFFNVIALPLLIGMGQDYGIHLYHRYREEGPGRLGVVLRGTGSAIFFTSLTTVIGFSGMMFVDHPGLASLGKVSVIGITLCLVASVVFVPALLRLGEWRRRG